MSVRGPVPTALAQAFLDHAAGCTPCAAALVEADLARNAGRPPTPAPEGPPGLCAPGSAAYRAVWDAAFVDVVP